MTDVRRPAGASSSGGHPAHQTGGRGRPPVDTTERPLMVYWELTRACDLACRHCRAEAIPTAHPQELSTQDGYTMLDNLAGFGEPLPHLVFTGGDPLRRREVFDLLGHAQGLGFNVAITPAGTPLLNRDMVRRFHQAGVWMMALSLDGSTPHSHDALRGVAGSYTLTVKAARWAREVGLPIQVNTLVCAETLEDLPAIYASLVEVGVTQWALFFLISVGRGTVLQQVTPEQSEDVMRWVYDVSQDAPFRIRTTEAPYYRRVTLQRSKVDRLRGDSTSGVGHVRSAFGIWDGNGIMFISHMGDIYPSGFLPLVAGSVRRANPVDVYRHAPTFLTLRDADMLKGKCGLCEYRKICGGSRARAYAATGDFMESDPLCPHQPTPQKTALASTVTV